jgi:hypothetical protein
MPQREGTFATDRASFFTFVLNNDFIEKAPRLAFQYGPMRDDSLQARGNHRFPQSS